MPHTIDDLREALDEATAHAPHNNGRLREVRRRIRRDGRRRVGGGIVIGLAAVTAAAAIVPQLTATGPTAEPRIVNAGPNSNASAGTGDGGSETTEPPQRYQGMRRVLVQRFTVTNTKVRVEFTPTGPDYAITVLCGDGYVPYLWIGSGPMMSGTGSCRKAPPGKLQFGMLGGTFNNMALRPGKPTTVHAAVLPADVEVGSESPPADRRFQRGIPVNDYLATARPGRSSWRVVVYSGVCSECPSVPAP